MHPVLKRYVPLVEFIAQTVGPSCEVILHDFSDMEHSIVAISQNSLTGRKVGGTVTDFALGVVQNKEYQKKDFLVNYTGKAKESGQLFRSSTLYIKDDEGELLGMLCVNIDITQMQRAKEALESLMMLDRLTVLGEDPQQKEQHESFSSSPEELMNDMLHKTLATFAPPPERFNLQEKKDFVSALSQNGFFLLKGAVPISAATLGVSEQTIYRYLKETSNESK